MRSYLITLKSNKAIRQYVVDCVNPSREENTILRDFLKYEDIKWEDDEELISAEMRKL